MSETTLEISAPQERLLLQNSETICVNPERGIVLDKTTPCGTDVFNRICAIHDTVVQPGGQAKIPVAQYKECDGGVVIDEVPIRLDEDKVVCTMGGNAWNFSQSSNVVGHHLTGEDTMGVIPLPTSLQDPHLSHLVQSAMDRSHPIKFTEDQPLRTSIIVINPDGRRAILSYTPLAMLQEKDYRTQIPDGKSIYTGSLDPALLEYLISYEGQIIFSPTSSDFKNMESGLLSPEKMGKLLRNPNMLLGLNAEEAERLVKRLGLHAGTSPAQVLHNMGILNGIVTNEDKPTSYWIHGSPIQFIHPITDYDKHEYIARLMEYDAPAGNPTGCGDTLLGAVAAGLSCGMDMDQAMRTGTQAAALVYCMPHSNLLTVSDSVLDEVLMAS